MTTSESGPRLLFGRERVAGSRRAASSYDPMRARRLLTSAPAKPHRPALRLRLAGVLALALIGVTCRDQDPLAPGLPGRASLPVAPSFEQPNARRVSTTSGGAFATLKSVRGTLTPVGGGTAYDVTANFVRDTAQLVFDVAFAGRSQRYSLVIAASDTAGDTLFRSIEEIVAEPGRNAPLQPLLKYVAPDTAVRSLTVAASDTMLLVGDSLTVSTSGRNSSQQSIAPIRAAWTVRDTSGAAVSARSASTARLFGGRSDDDVWVVAETFNGTTDSVLVHIRLAVGSVVLSADTLRLMEGEGTTVGAQVLDAEGSPLAREVSWMSQNPTVASVGNQSPALVQAPARSTQPSSNYVQVAALAAGTTRIIAKSGEKMDTVVVVVTPVPVESVVITPESVAMLPGKQTRLTASALDAFGNPLPGRSIAWSSGAPQIATVAGDGTVTAVSPGTALISASAEGKTGSATIRIDSVPAAIVRTAVAPQFLELRALGASGQLSASSYAADSSLAAADYAWSVVGNGGAIVAVDSLGRVTALATGSAYVRADEPGGTRDSALVTVTQVAARVTVTPPAVTVDAVGPTVTFHATVLDSLGSPIPTPSLSWYVDDPAIGQVELSAADSAVVKTVGAGYAKVVVWMDQASAAAELTVLQQQVAKTATLGPGTMTLGLGGRSKLTLSLFDESGILMPYAAKEVKWVTEGSGGVVRIDSVGEVLAESYGSVAVYAEIGEIITEPVAIAVSDNALPLITLSTDTLTVTDSAIVTVYLTTASQEAVFVALAESNGLLKLSAETLAFDKTTRQQVVVRRELDGTTTLTASDVGKRYASASMELYVGEFPEKIPDKSPAPPPPDASVAAPARRTQ